MVSDSHYQTTWDIFPFAHTLAGSSKMVQREIKLVFFGFFKPGSAKLNQSMVRITYKTLLLPIVEIHALKAYHTMIKIMQG